MSINRQKYRHKARSNSISCLAPDFTQPLKSVFNNFFFYFHGFFKLTTTEILLLLALQNKNWPFWFPFQDISPLLASNLTWDSELNLKSDVWRSAELRDFHKSTEIFNLELNSFRACMCSYPMFSTEGSLWTRYSLHGSYVSPNSLKPLLEVTDVSPDHSNLISTKNCLQNHCKISCSGCFFQETTPPTDTLALHKTPLSTCAAAFLHLLMSWGLAKNAMAANVSGLPDQIKSHFCLYKDNSKLT